MPSFLDKQHKLLLGLQSDIWLCLAGGLYVDTSDATKSSVTKYLNALACYGVRVSNRNLTDIFAAILELTRNEIEKSI